jgi:nucleoid-associated protein YgaU
MSTPYQEVNQMTKAAKALVPILSCLLIFVVGCARKPPTITSISPSSGPSGGGTQVTIRGENFKEGAEVTIAGSKLKNMVISEDKTTVTGVTPGGPPGRQSVIATNLKAKEPSAPSYFTYEALKVVSTDPSDGAQLEWYPRVSQASAKLSQPIQTGSVSMSIEDTTGQVSYDPSTQTVTFMADEPLKTGVTHQVTVSNAKDMAGNTMDAYSFSFSIQEAVRVTWYTVQEGDTLPTIAAKPEVYEDESKWMMIYRANQDEYLSEDGKNGNDAILDYKNLTPGMTLYIPREAEEAEQ